MMKIKTSNRHYLLTITGPDAAGIIAGITGLLYKRRCNLEDISMTILEGQFAMILVASAADWILLGKDIQIYAKRSGLTIHSKELNQKLNRRNKAAQNTTRFIVTAMGRDKTGIVFKISRLLAGYGLNITDLNSKILGFGPKAIYALMLETDIPKRFNVKKLESSLKKLQKTLNIELQLKPSELLSL